MASDLKPCPFCGSATLDIGRSKSLGGWMIECLDCQAVMLPSAADEAGAAEHWNRRTSEAGDGR